MRKDRQIQIPEKLFIALCRYFLLNDTTTEIKAIKDALESKIDAIERREQYAKYKNKNLTPEERSAARQKYLDMVGFADNYRW